MANNNNHGGKREGGGSKGYGHICQIKKNVKKHIPLWWTNWEEMMNATPEKDGLDWFNKKKLAMQEFNKLQIKMLPTQVEGTEDGEPIKIQLTDAKYAKIIKREASNITKVSKE